MKHLGLIAVCITIAATLTTPVMAEGGQGTYIEQKFKQSDTNGDGKLSLDEFKAAFPWIDAGKTFATADTNKDGFLSSAELKAAQGKKHARPA